MIGKEQEARKAYDEALAQARMAYDKTTAQAWKAKHA